MTSQEVIVKFEYFDAHGIPREMRARLYGHPHSHVELMQLDETGAAAAAPVSCEYEAFARLVKMFAAVRGE